jgi:hypothetical protein
MTIVNDCNEIIGNVSSEKPMVENKREIYNLANKIITENLYNIDNVGDAYKPVIIRFNVIKVTV